MLIIEKIIDIEPLQVIHTDKYLIPWGTLHTVAMQVAISTILSI